MPSAARLLPPSSPEITPATHRPPTDTDEFPHSIKNPVCHGTLLGAAQAMMAVRCLVAISRYMCVRPAWLLKLYTASHA